MRWLISFCPGHCTRALANQLEPWAMLWRKAVAIHVLSCARAEHCQHLLVICCKGSSISETILKEEGETAQSSSQPTFVTQAHGGQDSEPLVGLLSATGKGLQLHDRGGALEALVGLPQSAREDELFLHYQRSRPVET